MFLPLSGAVRDQSRKRTCHRLTFHLQMKDGMGRLVRYRFTLLSHLLLCLRPFPSSSYLSDRPGLSAPQAPCHLAGILAITHQSSGASVWNVTDYVSIKRKPESETGSVYMTFCLIYSKYLNLELKLFSCCILMEMITL